MAHVFHYPWRVAVKEVHRRLPAPIGEAISPELGAFVDDGDGRFVELPGPTLREGVGQGRFIDARKRQFLYDAGAVHQFQREATTSFARRSHFALTDAFIWLSGYLYRFREDTGAPLAERRLADACAAFREYLGTQRDFAPESLVVEIARQAPGAVASIVASPRKVLMREHADVPLDKIQELDVFSLVDLSRRPGRTVAMKAGPRQRLTALTRRETADTVENRVVLDFIHRSAAAARQYVDEMCARCPRRAACALRDPVTEAACPSARVKSVADYARLCAAWLRGGAFAEVARLKEPLTRPNYVLQQNVRYVRVWKYYLRLLRLEDVEDDVWRWRRAVWSDMVKMLFMMAWEERLRPKARLQTSRRPFMIRAANRNGRWLVPTPFEDALVFGAGARWRTLYLLGTDDAIRLTGNARLAQANADFFVVVAKGDGAFETCPVWAFCPDAKCEATRKAEALAKDAARELNAAHLAGLCVFPSDENVRAAAGRACCLGLNAFSPQVEDVLTRLANYVEGVLS